VFRGLEAAPRCRSRSRTRSRCCCRLRHHSTHRRTTRRLATQGARGPRWGRCRSLLLSGRTWCVLAGECTAMSRQSTSSLTVIFFAVLLEESLVSRVESGGSLDAVLQSQAIGINRVFFHALATSTMRLAGGRWRSTDLEIGHQLGRLRHERTPTQCARGCRATPRGGSPAMPSPGRRSSPRAQLQLPRYPRSTLPHIRVGRR
jgi:hypothetical protein